DPDEIAVAVLWLCSETSSSRLERCSQSTVDTPLDQAGAGVSALGVIKSVCVAVVGEADERASDQRGDESGHRQDEPADGRQSGHARPKKRCSQDVRVRLFLTLRDLAAPQCPFHDACRTPLFRME